jgi:hypothetical protein
MKAITNWKVTNHDGEFLGVYDGHIVDIARQLSGIPTYYLWFEETKEEPFTEIIPPPILNTVRFLIAGVKKEWQICPPDVKQEYYQKLFLSATPKNENWLLVQVSPYLKMEFI